MTCSRFPSSWIGRCHRVLMLQVLQRSGGGALSVRHSQTPDVWECGALAEGAERPRRQQHCHHAGWQQERPAPPQGRAHGRGPGLRRYCDFQKGTKALDCLSINMTFFREWEEINIYIYIKHYNNGISSQLIFDERLFLNVCFLSYPLREEQSVIHRNFSIGLNKCRRSLQEHPHRYSCQLVLGSQRCTVVVLQRWTVSRLFGCQ